LHNFSKGHTNSGIAVAVRFRDEAIGGQHTEVCLLDHLEVNWRHQTEALIEPSCASIVAL
jgi:hypothetical protein